MDVYAFGVILWEIVSHGDFFGEEDFMTVIEDKVIAGAARYVASVICNLARNLRLSDFFRRAP